MALLLTPARWRKRLVLEQVPPRPHDVPSVLFTRMTTVEDTSCLDCGRPSVVSVEDFAGSYGRLRRRRPLTYLRCTSCGSRDQSEA